MRRLSLVIAMALSSCVTGHSHMGFMPSKQGDLSAILSCVLMLKKGGSMLLASDSGTLAPEFRGVRIYHGLIPNRPDLNYTNLTFGNFFNDEKERDPYLISDARGIECSVEPETSRVIRLLAPEKQGSRKLVYYIEPDKYESDSQYQILEELAKRGKSVTLVQRLYRYKRGQWVQVGGDDIRTVLLSEMLGIANPAGQR